jgi:regulator of cell morphogenesis and NO signaling
MLIAPEMKMAEVIHLNYQLLPIISRFGIQLGFGDKTIIQVCRDHSLDVEFFLEILNSYHDSKYFPRKHLQGFPMKLLLDYLRKSHDYYLRIKIPQLEQLLEQLSGPVNDPGSKSFDLIDKFFREYKEELSEHIKHEEEKVYPYVYEVEEAFRKKIQPPELIQKIRDYSIDDYESEHDNVEDELFDLKNIIIKYLPQPADTDLCHSILIELFRLEADLKDHARIEDKVLVPKVRFMEKWIIDQPGT